jgi:hypothetical protein
VKFAEYWQVLRAYRGNRENDLVALEKVLSRGVNESLIYIPGFGSLTTKVHLSLATTQPHQDRPWILRS